MRATALREPGLVRRANHDVVVTPADWSRSGADPQTNWTKRRGPVTYYDTAGTLDVSTGANEATFYSGAGNRALAEQFAEENGRSTLEMTPGGKWLDQEGLFGPRSPLTRGEAVAVWSRLSGRFAAGASGTAVGFVQGASPYGVWATTELPALESNPAITNIITALAGGG